MEKKSEETRNKGRKFAIHRGGRAGNQVVMVDSTYLVIYLLLLLQF